MSGPFFLFKPSVPFALAVAALALLMPQSRAASTLAAPGSGLSVELDAASGSYKIISREPAWTFGGTLGQPLENVATSPARDGLGASRQITFDWQAGPLPMSGRIRIYSEKALALFTQTCRRKSELPPAAFPAFTVCPVRCMFSATATTNSRRRISAPRDHLHAMAAV